MILVKNYLEKLSKNKLTDLAKFVVTENFKHHSKSELNEVNKNYENDFKSIYKQELDFYENSEVFITRDKTGDILGAIRLLKWNCIDILPIQTIFGINPLLTVNQSNINHIYHIGRFAVKKDVRDITLFKKLLVSVANTICNHGDNVAFAECDRKLLRILKLLGVKATAIGESVNYLGSETIPIMMTSEGIIDFFNKNKHLLVNNLNETSDTFFIPNQKAIKPRRFSA